MARNVTRKKIELNTEDVTWFEEQYPNASLPATLSMLLSKFREQNTYTPKDYAELAAKALKEEMGT